MPRSPAPPWRRLKEPIMDDHVRASVQAVNGKPDSETGFYGTLVIAGIATRERANELRQGLFRAALRQKVSMNVEPFSQADDGTFVLTFRAINKEFARAYLVKVYGPDRARWPYDPRRKES